MEEIWKDIEGYEGLYQVSNTGKVRKYIIYRSKWKNLKLMKNNKGYYRVHLCKNKISKEYKVHRLVGITFIPNPENKPEINHINGIKTDNRVENLEWNTHKENMTHAFYKLKRQHIVSSNVKEKSKKNKQKQVIQYAIKIEKIAKYNSIKEASEINNISRSAIGKCCNRKQKDAGGYIWQFENDEIKDKD